MTEKRKNKGNFPNLRFPEFTEEASSSYKRYSFNNIFYFSTGKNIKQNEASPEFEIPCVRYGELYYMYGEVINEIFNRTNLNASELCLSNGDEILLPSAGEDPLDIGSASALIIKNVAIGRTINILKPINEDLYSPIYVSYYINQKLKKKISTLAKGSSISNVYNSDLKKLDIILPNINEQKKITFFLSLIDDRIQTQKKIIEELKLLKNSVVKRLFDDKLKFKNRNANFPSWEKKKLAEICKEHLHKNPNNLYSEVFSVSKHKGVINQIEHLGRSFSAKEITHYKLVYPGDLVYTKSPTSEFPFGIIKQNKTGRIGVVSPLYCVFTPKNFALGYLLHEYFNSHVNTFNYLNPLVQKGAKNTMNINNDIFLNGAKLLLPMNEIEQNKIYNALSLMENKIDVEQKILKEFENQKKYLLSNLFI